MQRFLNMMSGSAKDLESGFKLVSAYLHWHRMSEHCPVPARLSTLTAVQCLNCTILFVDSSDLEVCDSDSFG